MLVINSGSSSLKFQLVEPVAGMSRAAGLSSGSASGHPRLPIACSCISTKMLGRGRNSTCRPAGWRSDTAVHGGTEFHQPTLGTVIGKLE